MVFANTEDAMVMAVNHAIGIAFVRARGNRTG
jgi:hypothetical protein